MWHDSQQVWRHAIENIDGILDKRIKGKNYAQAQ